MERNLFSPEQSENRIEYGKNVEILIKFIRHGERDPDGNLTDYGRHLTRQKVHESRLVRENFDAVKAIGSPAGPAGETGMQRSLETAHIYAQEIAGDEAFRTRINRYLSYENLKTPSPYNHTEIYNANLPENYDDLSDEEKAKAAAYANTQAVNHLIGLKTPEAQAYKREIAGSFAYVISHYQEVARRLKDESKVLLPAGSHGGMLELILEEALVRVDEEGNTMEGFESLEEVGGAFMPSEAFNVDIATDESKNFQPLTVSFDNPNRPSASQMYLDGNKILELKEFYEQLHQEPEN